MKKILIFDTDYALLNKIDGWLRNEEYDIRITDDIKTAKARLTSCHYNLLVLGVRYIGCDGMKLLNWVNSQNFGIPFMVMLGKDDNNLLADAFRKGAHDHIDKRTLTRACFVDKINEALRFFNHIFDSYVYRSHEYTQCLNKAIVAARNNEVVLLSGEVGTGKSHIARHIHYNSKRGMHLFLPVKCGLLDHSRSHEQLFGLSTTITSKPMTGILEKVGMGTLFFDEIDKLPLNAQTALVHVIEEGKYSPMGSHMIKSFNARILFSTSANLSNHVLKGTFRRDLFDLLQNNIIKVPSLRMCREDIIPLSEYFLNIIARERNTTMKSLSKSATLHIASHDWHGNIRELRSILKRADMECDTNLIKTKHLHLNSTESHSKGDEEKVILDALAAAGNNKSIAARMLGISRPTLYSKMTKLNIHIH